MKKRVRNPQTKHLKHEMVVEPTTTAHHKFVMKCADCNGAFVKWATAEEYEIYMSLQCDNDSDAI